MKKKFNRVAVLMGGISSESEVSLRSGNNVYQALINKGYDAVKIDPFKEEIPRDIDAAYNTLHGQGGEDGVIQGVLTFMGIPYTGPKIASSAISMDKVLTKQILISNKIPTPEFEILTSHQTSLDFPLIIKPADGGSSIGIAIIKNQQELNEHYEQLSREYNKIFVEQFITGKEITVGIIQKPEELQILPILQLKSHNEFYDYEAKYTHGKTEFILPANISETATQKARQIALDAFNALDCKGVSRIDMIVDDNDDVYVIENNTNPGMTDLSDLPAQAKHAGIEYDDLVQIIMESASL